VSVEPERLSCPTGSGISVPPVGSEIPETMERESTPARTGGATVRSSGSVRATARADRFKGYLRMDATGR
jgi:hypothetical protein